jgi:hypothetical protein
MTTPPAENGPLCDGRRHRFHFLVRDEVHILSRYNLLETLLLPLEFLQLFRITSFLTPALIPPLVLRLLGALEIPTHRHHRVALTKRSVSLQQLTNSLLRRVISSLHFVIPSPTMAIVNKQQLARKTGVRPHPLGDSTRAGAGPFTDGP